MSLPLVDETTLSPFHEALRRCGTNEIRRTEVSTLQVNVGKRCNLACHHCHVEAGPLRTEMMDGRTAERILDILDWNPGVKSLDLTGGAPELNEHFRMLVAGARARSRQVIDRCNLTVLFEPGQEETAEFLAANGVKVVASLPCYSKENVERQRGRSVFEGSIEALRLLNELGYAQPASALELDLVFNPLGPSLSPDQRELEERYRRELSQLGIEFNALLTMTNMPIKRFAHALERDGNTAEYMSLLVNHFNTGTLPDLMCRSLVSVGWNGQLFDCDFNQMLEIPMAHSAMSIFDIRDFRELVDRTVATDEHCYGCTAGAGSSCGGALAKGL